MTQLVDVRAAARTLGVSEKTVKREVTAGRLAVVRVRGAVRFRVQELERYIARQTVSAA